MNIKKEINKDIAKSAGFLGIGVLSLFIGYVLDFEKHAMTGIAFGFIPTGLLLIIVYSYAKKKPKMVKAIEMEKEERNIFINTKAGHSALWVSYWYVFVFTILSNVFKLSLTDFQLLTLVVMMVTYFGFVIYYHRKY